MSSYKFPSRCVCFFSAGLGEHKLRDLNDLINKLLREKYHWERQIKKLGGSDFRGTSDRVAYGGKEVPGSRGYKYFGAAKDLPGVKELFEEVSLLSSKMCLPILIAADPQTP